MRVALVAGATRGAGRAIAIELARAGFFVYVTGRSSRTSGPSELDRPETIEETGDLIRAAGGAGAVRVVDHEDPDAVAELVAAVECERGRLDVLVNDIFGGDRYMQWDKPLWEHDWQGGLRMLQMGVHTHLITSRAAIPLMLRTAPASAMSWRSSRAGNIGISLVLAPTSTPSPRTPASVNSGNHGISAPCSARSRRPRMFPASRQRYSIRRLAGEACLDPASRDP